MSSPIEHIVLYSFKNAQDLKEAKQQIKSLQTEALKDGKPYVLSIKCGTTRPSPPVRSQGFNLISITTFASDEDRLYFVKTDPEHKKLVDFVKDRLDKNIMVLDFVDNEAEAVSIADC